MLRPSQRRTEGCQGSRGSRSSTERRRDSENFGPLAEIFRVPPPFRRLKQRRARLVLAWVTGWESRKGPAPGRARAVPRRTWSLAARPPPAPAPDPTAAAAEIFRVPPPSVDDRRPRDPWHPLAAAATLAARPLPAPAPDPTPAAAEIFKVPPSVPLMIVVSGALCFNFQSPQQRSIKFLSDCNEL